MTRFDENSLAGIVTLHVVVISHCTATPCGVDMAEQAYSQLTHVCLKDTVE